jgi:hypothetical protein
MMKEFGFCQRRRVFKNSATYQETETSLNSDHLQSTQDIGNVDLAEFLVKFGKSTGLLPNCEQKLEELMSSVKNDGSHRLINEG